MQVPTIDAFRGKISVVTARIESGHTRAQVPTVQIFAAPLSPSLCKLIIAVSVFRRRRNIYIAACWLAARSTTFNLRRAKIWATPAAATPKKAPSNGQYARVLAKVYPTDFDVELFIIYEFLGEPKESRRGELGARGDSILMRPPSSHFSSFFVPASRTCGIVQPRATLETRMNGELQSHFNEFSQMPRGICAPSRRSPFLFSLFFRSISPPYLPPARRWKSFREYIILYM